jgi:hypothetical protein
VRALGEGGHRTVLRLDPEHLGAVTLTVDVHAGSVRMTVSGGADALAAVREGLAQLRSSLAQAGLDLGDVALRADGVQAPQPGAPAGGSGPDGNGQAWQPGQPGESGQNGDPGRSGRSGHGDGHRPGDGAAPARTGGPGTVATAPGPGPGSAPAGTADTAGGRRRLDIRV